MPTPSQNAQTAVSFLHRLGNDRDAALKELCDPEKFVYSVAPKSFNVPSASYREYISRSTVVKDLKFEIHQAVGGEDGAAVWCTSNGVLLTDGQPYKNEYCWMFEMDVSAVYWSLLRVRSSRAGKILTFFPFSVSHAPEVLGENYQAC